MKTITKFTFCIFLALIESQCVGVDDWPQWRGAERDGTWNESGVVDKLPAEAKFKWKVPIGNGYTGPTVADGMVYVMDRMTDPEQTERILCFEGASGKQVWKHEYPCQYRIGFTAGPRASVTIDGKERAYAFGAMGQLTCLDAKKGKVLWEKDLNEEYSIESRSKKDNRMPIWGMACSPLIYKDKVILQIGAAGAGVVAFDKLTGEEAWRATDHRGQYSSPILTKQGNQDVVICWTGDAVVGIDPEKGTVHWTIDWKPRNMPIGCASPVLKDNHLFMTSFYDGSMLVKLDRDSSKAENLWHRVGENERDTDALHSIISTPIWIKDHIYGVDSYGEFRCLEAKTGDRVWLDSTAVPRARWSTIYFVQNDDLIWMFNERGELMTAKLSPSSSNGFEELSRTKILEPTKRQLNQRGGVCWSHPAFAMKSVFARNDKELVCVDLSETHSDAKSETPPTK